MYVNKSIRSEEVLRTVARFLKGLFMFFSVNEKGQGLVEYAIILALVAIVVIAVMRLMGPKLGNTYSLISNSIP